MNITITHKKECVGRIVGFGGRGDIVFTAKETGLFDDLALIHAELEEAATQQDSGGRGFREYSGERAGAAVALRTQMRDIAELAKALDERGIDVGAAEAFRMPRYGTYASLAAAGRSFAELIEPRKALYIERGLPATVVEDLNAQADVLVGVGSNAGGQRSRQVGGTAGLSGYADAAMQIVRELRAMLRVKFRNRQDLLAEWTSLSRVQRSAGTGTPKPAPAPPTPPTEPPPSSGSTPA
jgi:hypothetical protein